MTIHPSTPFLDSLREPNKGLRLKIKFTNKFPPSTPTSHRQFLFLFLFSCQTHPFSRSPKGETTQALAPPAATAARAHNPCVSPAFDNAPAPLPFLRPFLAHCCCALSWFKLDKRQTTSSLPPSRLSTASGGPNLARSRSWTV